MVLRAVSGDLAAAACGAVGGELVAAAGDKVADYAVEFVDEALNVADSVSSGIGDVAGYLREWPPWP